MTSVDFTVTADMARQLAESQGVCGRPLLRRVQDRQNGTEDTVAIPCGSTREAVCPACAHRARVLRMQQCTEGWHLTHEPDQDGPAAADTSVSPDDLDEDQDDDDDLDEGRGSKRVRSTRRRQDVPDLPRLPVEDRTIGRSSSPATVAGTGPACS